MSLGPGGSAPGAFAQPAAQDPRAPIILRMRRGAGWFLTIAILSSANSLACGAMPRRTPTRSYMIWQGYAAARELAQIQQDAQPGLSQPTLP